MEELEEVDSIVPTFPTDLTMMSTSELAMAKSKGTRAGELSQRRASH
jgi:hypothetical protein